MVPIASVIPVIFVSMIIDVTRFTRSPVSILRAIHEQAGRIEHAREVVFGK